MTKDQIAEVLDRVRNWPRKRQGDVARILMAMERADTSPYHLTSEQVEEVKRRMSQKKPRYASKKQMDALWKKCGL